MLIVPKGVEHKPIAKKEVWLLLFEPNNIKHTPYKISNTCRLDAVMAITFQFA